MAFTIGPGITIGAGITVTEESTPSGSNVIVNYLSVAGGGGGGAGYAGGGGSVGPTQQFDPDDRIGYGGRGAVRIIWGSGRSFPNNAATV